MTSKDNCLFIREKPKENQFFSYLYPTNAPSQRFCTCEDPPSIIFGVSCPLPPIEDEDTQYRFKPLYSLGLFWIKILKRILIPASGCLGVSVVHAKEKEKELECDKERKLVRARDLPIYVDEKCETCVTPKEVVPVDIFVDTIRCAREELWILMEQARIVSNQMSVYYSEVKKEGEGVVSFLREESNLIPRVGAIAIGGLSGYILALRKGIFKKLLYSTTGATAMAALCYPKEAQEYTEEGLKQSKKYLLLGYHFLNGVSRDLTGYQLPPLPSGHLVISDGHHHHHSDPADAVPSTAHLLPPTVNATHIPMPHEEKSEEIKRHLKDQSSTDEKDLHTRM